MHVAISGNIGSGKTTLTTKLAKHYKWEPYFEDVDNNPYLNDFYKEKTKIRKGEKLRILYFWAPCHHVTFLFRFYCFDAIPMWFGKSYHISGFASRLAI